jgi:hypothetical protein
MAAEPPIRRQQDVPARWEPLGGLMTAALGGVTVYFGWDTWWVAFGIAMIVLGVGGPFLLKVTAPKD